MSQDSGWFEVGFRADCPRCGKDTFWFFGKPLCECQEPLDIKEKGNAT